ncbi:ribosome maturation factor RimP [Persicitalea sp.]|uniref:ribosome maturation factor RimP n=1 Tax=Persicitalea sp. TaxID=3100273 RepID=UPI0035932C9A
MVTKEQIQAFLEPLLEDGKYFTVDIQFKPVRGSQKVLIMLDSDEGITIQECADVSRQLGQDMEAAEVLDTAYTLEVSSPGLDQPLRLLRQFRKNIGRNLKVTLNSGESLTGTLLEAKENSIVLQLPTPKKKLKVPLDEASLRPELNLDAIAKAIVQVSFK